MHPLSRSMRFAAVGAFLGLAACEVDKQPGPTEPGGGALFQRYVSLGNSITAGWQSGGINDSTQRRSYAVLLAQAMGTQFAYPGLAMPGCPPPVANFLTGALAGPGGPSACSLRSGLSATDVFNNVAMPSAVAADPTSASATTAGTPLHLLILGSKTQTQRALEAQPTFASIWIGNNDVLGPALTGLLGPTAGVTSGLTSVASFQASYKAMMDQLVQGAPGLKGVLIGVVQVSQTPVFVPASALSNPLVLAAIAANTGRLVTVDQACAASGALVVLRIVEAIRTGQHPPFISCTKNVPAAPIGDLFVLDAAEQTTLRTTVDAYNAYIRSQADANGFAYYDPNVLLAARKAAGEIPVLPNFTSATQPFGPLLSLDGVHPSSAAHRLIANELVAVINAKYGTGLGGIQ